MSKKSPEKVTRPDLVPCANGSIWIALFAGLAGALSFQPVHWAFLIPLTPLGLFLAGRSAATPRRAFLRVLGGAFIFYFGAIHWLCTLYHFNFMAPAGIAFVGFYMALYPAAGAYVMRRWLSGAHILTQFAAWSAWWLLFEWFRTLGRLSMPFTLISHSWTKWPSLIQFASAAGEIGVSFQILLLSAGLLAATLALMPKSSPWLGRLGCLSDVAGDVQSRRIMIITCFSALATFGVIGTISILRFHHLATPSMADQLKVLVVQPNIDQYTKMASYMHPEPQVRQRLQEAANQIHEDLLRTASKGTQLIVMPETTFASLDFIGDYGLHRRIEAMLDPIGADALFGADRVIFDDLGNPTEFYNSSYFVPHGSAIRSATNQDKMRLVPFGEHLPYFDMIPFFNDTLVQIASFHEGKEITIFESRDWKFGALICFESTFGLQARRITAKGANFLCIITNDAWYRWSEGDGPVWSAGPAQHHALSIMRAIETRRPVIRAANTGISSVIRHNGAIIESLSLGKRGVLESAIQPQRVLTLYVRFGNSPLVLLCMIVLGIIFVREKKVRTTEPSQPGRT